MSVIRFMFEGELERVALRKLLTPLFKGRSLRIEWSRRYQGRDDVIKAVPKLARIECGTGMDRHIFALVDLHPRHPKWQSPDDFKRGVLKTVDVHLRRFVHFHLAVHDIESWILGDGRRLAEMLGLQEDQFSRRAEEIDMDEPPKYLVRKLFRRCGRQYRETAEGIELVGGIRIGTVYQRCRHFKMFLDDLVGTADLNLESVLSSQP